MAYKRYLQEINSYKGNVMSELRKNPQHPSRPNKHYFSSESFILPFFLCTQGITIRELVALGYLELIMEDVIEYQAYPSEPVSLTC